MAAHHPPPCPHFYWRLTASVVLFLFVIFCAFQSQKSRTAKTPNAVGTKEDADISRGGVEASVDHAMDPELVPEAADGAGPPTLLIDPGHGGTDPGTVAGGQHEKVLALMLSKDLTHEMERRGWKVEMTRQSDVTLKLEDRPAIANAKPRLALISIHLNSGEPEANGVEVYYSWPPKPEVLARLDQQFSVPIGKTLLDTRARLLAERLLAAICLSTGAKNREVRNRSDLAITSRTVCPSVLVECGFLSHPAEGQALQTAAYREKLVHGLAEGLHQWLTESVEPGFGIQIR